MAPYIYLTNRNPAVYENPAEFRPERFLDKAPDTFSWIPFGGGISRCIGASFAQVEMKLILGTVLSELRPRPAGHHVAARRAGEPQGDHAGAGDRARGWCGRAGLRRPVQRAP